MTEAVLEPTHVNLQDGAVFPADTLVSDYRTTLYRNAEDSSLN
jgi:hypothetical protein